MYEVKSPLYILKHPYHDSAYPSYIQLNQVYLQVH